MDLGCGSGGTGPHLGQRRRDEVTVETETRGRRPGRWLIVQVTVTPGSLTLVAARVRPVPLADVRVLMRAVERRRRAISAPLDGRFLSPKT
jgi:hypothetical protein